MSYDTQARKNAKPAEQQVSHAAALHADYSQSEFSQCILARAGFDPRQNARGELENRG